MSLFPISKPKIKPHDSAEQVGNIGAYKLVHELHYSTSTKSLWIPVLIREVLSQGLSKTHNGSGLRIVSSYNVCGWSKRSQTQNFAKDVLNVRLRELWGLVET